MNSKIKKSFYDEYVEDLYEYIEMQKIRELKNNPKYLELQGKIIDIKQNNAKIRKFIEEDNIDTMSEDEMVKLLDLIRINEEINAICEGIIFKLGFKEACSIIF